MNIYTPKEYQFLTPERRPHESREQYVIRRLRGNKAIKNDLRGRLLWSSSRRGTYRRAIHGELR